MSSLRQGPPAQLLPAARPARNGRALRPPPSKVVNIFLQWGQTPLRPAGSWAALAHVPVSMVFFLLGAQLAKMKCTKLSLRSGLLYTIACMTGLVLSFLFKEQITEHYFTVLFEPLFMIGVLWFAYDIVDEKFHVGKYPEGLNVLFFVYCMHLIILCWSGGVMRVLLGANPAARLCGYFALWMTFWIDVAIAYGMRRKFPRAFAVLAGGR